jgi:hypothetical protein
MKPHRLKLELMHFGVEPSDDALNALPQSGFGEVVHKDFPTTGGLIFKLPAETYANVPIKYGADPEKLFSLEFEAGVFKLKRQKDNIDISVEIMPPPYFALHNIRCESGEPVRNMVMSHADRVRISPIAGCGFNCRFCNMPSLLYRRNPLELLDEAFKIAIDDPLLKPVHALISGGSPYTEEEDYKYLNDVYSYFPNAYPQFAFDFMLIPRTFHYDDPGTKENYRNYLYFLKDCGAKTISVNMELFNSRIRKEYAPEKEEIGTKNYLLFLELAADIFEQKVRSVLIVGLEPAEDTIAGVREIAKRGCLPELSPFVPDPGAFLARKKAPDIDMLETILLNAAEESDKYGVHLEPFCKPCSHNVIILGDI